MAGNCSEPDARLKPGWASSRMLSTEDGVLADAVGDTQKLKTQTNS